MKTGHLIDIDKITSPEILSAFPEVLGQVSQKDFTIKDANIKNWVVKNWQKEGLLLSDYQVEKWRKFNFIEIVWLRIISKLRSFNISIETIRELKDFLFTSAHFDSPADRKLMIDFILKANKGKVSETEVIRILESDEVKAELINLRKPLLYYFVLDVILLKNHLSILVTEQGDSMPYKDSFRDYLLGIKPAKDILLGSHVNISISEVLAEFIGDQGLDVCYDKLHLLTLGEATLINHIREGNLKSLKIKFNEDHEISMLEIEKNEPIKNAKELIGLIMSNGYQDIKYTTVRGKIVNCVNTRKIKIDKLKSTE